MEKATANSSVEMIPAADAMEPEGRLADVAAAAAPPSVAELRAAARLIVDRAVQLAAKFRALPPPLFHDSSPLLLNPETAGSESDVDRVLTAMAKVDVSIPSALLLQPSDVKWTASLVDAATSATNSWSALMMFALMQMRVERHQAAAAAPKEMEIIALETARIIGGRSSHIVLGWLLWRQAAFSHCLHAEVNWHDAVMLIDHRRPAHALHLLASMSDAVMREVVEPAVTQQNLRITRHKGDTLLVVRDEMHARCDQLWRDVQAAKSSRDEATRERRLRDATASFRQWICAQQQSLPSRLRAATVLSLSGFSIVDSCVEILSPIVDDPTVPILLTERVDFAGTLLERMCAVGASLLCATDGAAAAAAVMEGIIQRLERRMRVQSDEQLERDAAFEAVAAVCCEVPLTPGNAAHSLVDYLLGRLRRRLLASGSRLSLSPTFRWSDLLSSSLLFGAQYASCALPHRPMLRLLFAHGLTTSHNGQDWLVAILEATEIQAEAALRDFCHPDCEDLSMSELDWLAPFISVPSETNPLIGAEPQFVLLEASSFEEERIRCIEATARDQQIDPSTQLPVLAAAHEAHKDAAADTTLSQPTFNLLSAAELSTPTLAADHFDLHAPPAEYSNRMAQLGQAADCFSGPVLPASQVPLPDNDLLRRMEACVRTRPNLLPRLDLLKSAASRWYHRCFPSLRAAVEAHLIPDLASIVLSYVTADERVLRALPPPPPLPLPAVGAFAPPRPSAVVASTFSFAAAPPSFGSFAGFGSGPASSFGAQPIAFPAFGSAAFPGFQPFSDNSSLAFAASTAAASAFGFGSAPAFSAGTQPFAFGVSSSSVPFCEPTSAAPSSQPAVTGFSSAALAFPFDSAASFASTAFGGGAPAHGFNATEAPADASTAQAASASSSGSGLGPASDEPSSNPQRAEPAADPAAGSVTAVPPVAAPSLAASDAAKLGANEPRADSQS